MNTIFHLPHIHPRLPPTRLPPIRCTPSSTPPPTTPAPTAPLPPLPTETNTTITTTVSPAAPECPATPRGSLPAVLEWMQSTPSSTVFNFTPQLIQPASDPGYYDDDDDEDLDDEFDIYGPAANDPDADDDETEQSEDDRIYRELYTGTYAKSGVPYAALASTRELERGEDVAVLPEDTVITVGDVAADPVIGGVVGEFDAQTSLVLFIMQERAKGAESPWQSALACLPESTLSPVLWSAEERNKYLLGSFVIEQVQEQETEMQKEWDKIRSSVLKDETVFPADVYNLENFKRTCLLVASCCRYVDQIQSVVLIPFLGCLRRSSLGDGVEVEYDEEKDKIVLRADRAYSPGQEILLNDTSPNSVRLMALGQVELNSQNDFVTYPAALNKVDPLFKIKQSILEDVGYDVDTKFAVYNDRIPTGLMGYQRLVNVGDVAQIARVSFTDNLVIDQDNEYAALQTLFNYTRDRLAQYMYTLDEDRRNIMKGIDDEKQLLATLYLRSEKKILAQQLASFRAKLAPIRGLKENNDPSGIQGDVLKMLDTYDNMKNPTKWWGMLVGNDEQELR